MPKVNYSTQLRTDIGAMRCIVDEKGYLLFVSPAIGWSLGIDSEALISKPVNDIIDIVLSHDSNHQSTDFNSISSGFYEVALLRQNRDPLVLQARIDLINAPNGKKYRVIWLDPDNRMNLQKSDSFIKKAQDFTTLVIDNSEKFENKLQNKKNNDICILSEEDNELKNFLGLTNDLLAIYSRTGNFIRSNPAFNRIFGYSDSDLKALSFIDLIFPEDRPAVIDSLERIKESKDYQETVIEFQSRICCKDGNVRFIHWAYKITGKTVYIVGKDITEIKRHEEELYHREKQLLEAQKIGRMGHWYWDLKQPRLEWSDQIYSIFGVEKYKFVPTLDNINSMLFKKDLRKIYKSFKHAAFKKEDYEIEFKLQQPKGGVSYIHCEGRCKINPDTGEVEALFGIMQDITERRLHEQALHDAKETAESAYASKTRFLANMSHELRTPLNAIIGFSEMMQSQLLGPIGNDRYIDYIVGIKKSGEHLLDLINDILDMSKIEIGKYEIYVEEINISKLIRLAIHMVEGRAEESGVHLITNKIPDNIQIIADRRALLQILLNILSNAVKFTDEGGSVELSCENNNSFIEIKIIDTGIGIPKDKINMVTMPFEQVNGELVSKHKGSGLGLAITKDLIELHGGTLNITSEFGKGTNVIVNLPEKPL